MNHLFKYIRSMYKSILGMYKSIISMVFLVILISACTSPAEKTFSELNEHLNSLRSGYAPDDRIQVWDLTIEIVDGDVKLSGYLSEKETYDALAESLRENFNEVENEVVLLPAEGEGLLVNALANNSVIHLRREPSSTKELVTQARLGAPVRVLKKEGGKSLIQVPDGYIGWVNTAELHLVDGEELAAYRDAEKLIFTAQYGQSFQEPDESSMPVTDLVLGNIVCKLSEVPGFTQIGYPDGRAGWTKSTDLLPAEEIFFKSSLQDYQGQGSPGEDLVQTALKFHGIPYLWGGTSSKNIDCSGLVCNIYFMNGIQLPRDADMQALIGRELSTEFVSDGLQPGDLLFFGRKATEEVEENVTHVAMYIGGGEYIHSAGYRERVGINSMDSSKENYIESYPDIFVRSVRILGEDYEGFRPISENAFYKEIINPAEYQAQQD